MILLIYTHIRTTTHTICPYLVGDSKTELLPKEVGTGQNETTGWPKKKYSSLI